jgi:hypothetical protein
VPQPRLRGLAPGSDSHDDNERPHPPRCPALVHRARDVEPTRRRRWELLQERLDALNDLTLTLKHIHWNVVGPHFIAVHTMLDPQYEAVSEMVDEVAERMATLGGAPQGTPGAWSPRVSGTTTASAG